MSASATLVCFAVKEEARFFKPAALSQGGPRVVVTGMGKANARRSFLKALEIVRPELVMTCGFAGGLNPAMESGQVVFATDPGSTLAPVLLAAGALPATFHGAARVATTQRDKQMLRETTGADAVEMESEVICSLCRSRQIPCAIVRVILDPATEDLPLDFNLLMRADETLDWGKLAVALLKAPGRLPGMLRLQQQSRRAAQRLGEVLTAVTGG